MSEAERHAASLTYAVALVYHICLNFIQEEDKMEVAAEAGKVWVR